MTGFSVIENTDPRNLEAERSLLGSLLRSNNFYEVVSDAGLTAAHFYNPDHAEVYRVITEMLDAGRSATPITLANHVDKALLSDLCDAKISPSLREVRDWALEISERAARRGMVATARELIEDAVTAEWGMSASDIIANAEAKLFALAPEAGDEGPVSFNDALDAAMDEIDRAQEPGDEARRVMTGWIDVDDRLGRMSSGDLVILAGRASMGKTAAALDIAENNARRGLTGLFFSMEMTKAQLAKRRLARVSGVSIKAQNGTLDDTQYHKVAMAKQELRALNLPLFIDQRPKLTLSQIRATARRLHRKHGLQYIVIDYLQIMGDDASVMNAQRTYQIGHNTAGLKALAKELDLPIILLAQVSRGVEKAEDKRPGMSDLKDSGAIEQDADTIMFVYREAYYLERNPPVQSDREKDSDFDDRCIAHDLLLREKKGVATILIAKARQGEAPVNVDIAFDGERVSFGNLRRQRES